MTDSRPRRTVDVAPATQRLLLGMGLVAAVIALGGVVLALMGRGQWALADTLYMAVISVSTVGFSELPGLENVPGGRLVTSIIIITGIGAFAFFQSSLTALVVEGTLGNAFRRKRMRAQVDALNGHVLVAGVGSTGRHVVEELWAAGTPFVVVDHNRQLLDRLSAELTGNRMLYICGDATEDQVLHAAGITRAGGVIAALTHDKDNLYVTLSARTFNPRARIVTKVVELEAVPKMMRAGANATVSPNIMGGRRMASEVIRPEMVELLDEMLRDKDRGIRLEEITVPEGCRYQGKTLEQAALQRETHVLLVAVRDAQRAFRYNPPQDTVLLPNTVLVVLGREADVGRLRELVLTRPG
jgi:voltage-gated potassium channel